MSVEVDSEGVLSPVADYLQPNKDVDLEKWRRKVRTRVTALKCHIMSSQGLTPDGRVVEPYSSDVLFEPSSSVDEVDTYIEVAMAKVTTNAMNEDNSSQHNLELDEVQFLIEDVNNSSSGNDLPSLSNMCSNSNTDSLIMQIGSDMKASKDNKDESQNSDLNYTEDVVGKDYDLMKEELLKRSREVEKLSKIRDDIENELQELTASLFQEAHVMVLGANQRAAAAEKSLKEAKMQVEVLQAEVTALKALVITSTPSSPNPHLHPQIIAKGAQALVEAGKIFHRGHKKSPSDFDLKYGRDTTPPSSPLKESQLQYDHTGGINGFPLDPECWEVDPVLHREFVVWRQDPSLKRDDPFMARVYSQDIDLCLAFPNSVLARKVQIAIEENALYIEEINPRQKNSCPNYDPDATRKCVLLDVPRYCKYRFRLGDKDDTWYYISQFARNRYMMSIGKL